MPQHLIGLQGIVELPYLVYDCIDDPNESKEVILKGRHVIQNQFGVTPRVFIPPHYSPILGADEILNSLGYKVYSTSQWDVSVLNKLVKLGFDINLGANTTFENFIALFSPLKSYAFISIDLEKTGGFE